MALRTGDIIMKLFKKCPGWKNLSEEELKKLKMTMVEISSDFIDVCEKYHLHYMMGAGTALGAVRHHGFIPWDDDMDFHMPRKDYMRFLEVAEKELGDKYFIRSISKGDDVWYPTIHVIQKGSRYVNFADLITIDHEPIEMQGIYVDIFPYDNASSIKIVRDLKGIMALTLMLMASCVNIKEDIKYLKAHHVDIDKADLKALALKKMLGSIFGVLSAKKWTKIIDKFLASNHNDNSEWVTCYYGKHLQKYTHHRKDLWGEKREVFEGHSWRIATNTDLYLTKEYSKDYMTPPPADKRKIHPVFELEFKK